MKEEIIDLENSTKKEIAGFTTRESVRAVLFNEKNEVCLIEVFEEVGNKHYYVLPGGGMDEGETKEESLKRECLEETGFDIEILEELCHIKELKKVSNLVLHSYCYICKTKGTQGELNLTDLEKEKNFKTRFFSIKEAKTKFPDDATICMEGQYVNKREKKILDLIDNNFILD